MKLYTEEQVRTIFDLAKLSVNGDEKYSKDELLESLTPIELPSEGQIANKILESIKNDDKEYGKLVYAGALWMLEQIKQQDNDKI